MREIVKIAVAGQHLPELSTTFSAFSLHGMNEKFLLTFHRTYLAVPKPCYLPSCPLKQSSYPLATQSRSGPHSPEALLWVIQLNTNQFVTIQLFY
jgi:hypothetical protein